MEHGVVSVRDGDDASGEWYGVAREMVDISAAIVVLVVVPHRLGHIREVCDLLQAGSAFQRVHFYLL